MANKGGTLANLGQALSGYGSALSGNPMYLQNSLLLRQAQQQQQQQEQAQRQEQVSNIASRSLMRGGPMTDENKAGLLRLAAPQAFNSALAQQAMQQLFPAKPTAQVLKPGETLGLTSADGKFTPTYTAPSEAKPLSPQSPLGKLESDYQAGLIDRATYEAAKRKENYIAPREERDTFGDQAKLRGEFDTKTKDFATTRDAYSRVVNVASDPSPAGDISLIFSFMKMNDPNSTVREGEYATAQNAGSVPQRVWGIYNKVLNGETLTPAQRADFVKQAGNLYGSQVNSFSQEYKRYSDLAQKYNFSADKIVYDRTAGLPAAMPVPGQAGSAQAGQPAARPRATNPVTGEVVEWNGSEWAKAK